MNVRLWARFSKAKISSLTALLLRDTHWNSLHVPFFSSKLYHSPLPTHPFIQLNIPIFFPFHSCINLPQRASARILHRKRLSIPTTVKVCQMRWRMRKSMLCSQSGATSQSSHGVQQQCQIREKLGHSPQMRMHQEMLLTGRCGYPTTTRSVEIDSGRFDDNLS